MGPREGAYPHLFLGAVGRSRVKLTRNHHRVQLTVDFNPRRGVMQSGVDDLSLPRNTFQNLTSNHERMTVLPSFGSYALVAQYMYIYSYSHIT